MSIDSLFLYSWSVEQVCQWSQKNIVEKKYANEDFIQLLIDNEIDGFIISDITEEHLEKHFKIRALGKRLKILAEIKKLRNELDATVKQENTQSYLNTTTQQTCTTFKDAQSYYDLNLSKSVNESKPPQKESFANTYVSSGFSKSSTPIIIQEPTESTFKQHLSIPESLDLLERFTCTPKKTTDKKISDLSSSHKHESKLTSNIHRKDVSSSLFKNIELYKSTDFFPSVEDSELNNNILETFMLQNKAASSSKDCFSKDSLMSTIDLTSPTEEYQTHLFVFERTSVEAYFDNKYKGHYEVDENHLYDVMYKYKNKKTEIIRKLSQILEEYTSGDERVLSMEEAVLVFIWEEFIKYNSLNTSNKTLPQIKNTVGFSQEFDVFYDTYMTEIQDHIYQKESLLGNSGMNSKNKNSLTFVKLAEINKKTKAKRLLWKENIRKNILANGKSFSNVKAKKPYVNPFLFKILKPHQRKGVEFLWNNLVVKKNGCILAHSMGLGKTLQVIAFLFSLFEAKSKNLKYVPNQLKDFKVLILCPLSVRSNWMIEFKKWIPDHHLINIPLFEVGDSVSGAFIDKVADVKEWYSYGGILVMSYNYFRALLENPESKITDESGLSIETCLLSPGPSLVIADEGHIIKNPQAKITNFIKKIHTPYKVCLSGYPIQNNLNEYWCMVDFVYPDFLGSKSFFEETFGKPITEALYKNCPSFFKKFGHLKLYLLNIALKNILYRLDSRLLINDLPQKTEVFISCKLSTKQQEMYLDCLDSLSCDPALLDACFFYKGNLLTDVCNHPQLIKIIENDNLQLSEELNLFDEAKSTSNISISRIKQSISKLKDKYFNVIDQFDSESSSKFTILTVIINETLHLGEKMLIFSRSLSMLDHIEQYLNNQRSPILYFRLDGSVSGKDRQKMFDQFNYKNDEHTVFLISTTAGCLGANICGATRIVLYDVDWNPSFAEQAIARSFRYGQTSRTYVYRLYTYGTWEDALVKCGDFKRTLASRVVDQKEAPDNHSKEKNYFQKPPNSFPKFINIFGDRDSIVNKIASEYSDSLVEIFEAETLFGDIEYSLSDDIKKRVLDLVAQEDREDEILPSEKIQMEFFDSLNQNENHPIRDTSINNMLTENNNQTPIEVCVKDPLTENECTDDTCLPWQISHLPENNNYSFDDRMHIDETVFYSTFSEDCPKKYDENSDLSLFHSVNLDDIDLCEDNHSEVQTFKLDSEIHDGGSDSTGICVPLKSPKRKLSNDGINDVSNEKTTDSDRLLSPNTNLLSAKILPIQFSSKSSLLPPRKLNEDKCMESCYFNTIPEIKKSVMGQDNQIVKTAPLTQDKNTNNINTSTKSFNNVKGQDFYSIKTSREVEYPSQNRNFNGPDDFQCGKSSRIYSNHDNNFNPRIYCNPVQSSHSFKQERFNEDFDQSKLYYEKNRNIPHFYLYSPEKRKDLDNKPLNYNRWDHSTNIKSLGNFNRNFSRYDESHRENGTSEINSDTRSDRRTESEYSRYGPSSQYRSLSNRYNSYNLNLDRNYNSKPMSINEDFSTGSMYDKPRQNNPREPYNKPKYSNIRPKHSYMNPRTNPADRNTKNVPRNDNVKDISFKADAQKTNLFANSNHIPPGKNRNFQRQKNLGDFKKNQDSKPVTHSGAQSPKPRKKFKKKGTGNQGKKPDVSEEQNTDQKD